MLRTPTRMTTRIYKDSNCGLQVPLPDKSCDFITPKSKQLGSRKASPMPKKRIDTLEKAFERIEELEIALKDAVSTQLDWNQKQKSEMAVLNQEFEKMKKLDEQHTLDKVKAGLENVLTIINQSRHN